MNHPSPTYAIGCVFNFKVEQEHIDEGIMAHCSKCPVALALKAVRPDAIRVVVGCGVSIWRQDGLIESWDYNTKTCSKILDYDQTGRMRPFTARMALRIQRRPSAGSGQSPKETHP